MASFTSVTDDVSNNLASYHNELITGLQGIEGPAGWLLNGQISVTVASNNLTVAVKNLAGNDPSASDPVALRIGNTVRLITAALSVTKNAGTNWCNAGGAELATKEIDYFAYIGYNATDGVVIGFSRYPGAATYGGFSATSTDEKYCAISTITTAASTDEYQIVGRFAATLSAGAGYTWTVPTFTPINLVQRPIYETRWLDWAPAYSASGSMTYTTVTTVVARYRLGYTTCEAFVEATGTTGGTASNQLRATLPFESVQIASAPVGYGGANDTGSLVAARVILVAGTPDLVGVSKYDVSNWGLAASKSIEAQVRYEI